MPAGLPGLSTDALAGYHFSIEVDGVTMAQFQEVSGITSELDVIELKENTLALRAGHGGVGVTFLVDAAVEVLQEREVRGEEPLDGRRRDLGNGSIVVYDYSNSEVTRYNFVNAWPSKVTTSALKAGANEIVTEEVTIVCEELERVK